MKIRTDFITNSSSAAFVIIGVRFDNIEDYDKMDYLAQNKGLRFFSEEKVIGKVIVRLDFDDYNLINIGMSQMQSFFREVKETLNELGIDEEIKLIAGMFAT